MTDTKQGSPANIFRDEALARRREGDAPLGDILRADPRWLNAAYWVLFAVCVSGLVFAASGSIYQYAVGPALVIAAEKTQVTARTPGLVATIETSPGARVKKGAVLAQLRSDAETAELERIEQVIEQQLARSLLDRTDRSAREALVSLRGQRDLAAAALAEKVVRAPHAGVVSDIRIRTGQHLDSGDVMLTIVEDQARFRVVAMLPGNIRPELRPGMPLRLELGGYRHSYQVLPIAQVGDQVVGPGEVRRFLGPELSDAVPLVGPVVLVNGWLEGSGFSDEGRTLPFHDGLQGTAQVPIRRTRMLVALIPWLKVLFE